MRVGILTYHDGINYGAFFQVLALQTFLEQQGVDCHVINYKSVGFTVREYQCFLNRKAYQKGELLNNIIKILKFRIAQNRHLHLTRRVFMKSQLSKMGFDVIFIGSDEVWNCGQSLMGCDAVYFSQALKAGKIFSYAASFGSITNSMAIPTELCIELQKLSGISVRDDNSARIVFEICKQPVHIVLDPTFLVDLMPQAVRSEEEDYILVYGFFDNSMVSQIIEYKKIIGKKLISIGYRNPWSDVNLITLNPFQWLGYFANAGCIITSMYHGMIFSILNQKEFVMFNTPYRANKIGNLMTELGVSNRLINRDDTLKEAMLKAPIAYPHVIQRIQLKRESYINFLKRALT